jgi:LmbE family N-acetylglucosaminyl deacetylase
MSADPRLLDALVRGHDVGPLLVVAAHPDDEVLWAGACLADRRSVTLAHLTDGAPLDPWFARQAGCASRDEYARLRAGELDDALQVLGLSRARRVSLGARDQEAAAELAALATALAREVRAVEPAVVVTHAYDGGHPDHDAAAFVVRAALHACPSESRPVLLEFAGYHGARGALEVGFLARPGPPARSRALDRAERERKARALRCYGSQRRVIELLGAGAHDGRFRVAPLEDFASPPHAGPLFYERHGWRIDGRRFRAHAVEAARILGAPTVLS